MHRHLVVGKFRRIYQQQLPHTAQRSTVKHTHPADCLAAALNHTKRAFIAGTETLVHISVL